MEGVDYVSLFFVILGAIVLAPAAIICYALGLTVTLVCVVTAGAGVCKVLDWVGKKIRG